MIPRNQIGNIHIEPGPDLYLLPSFSHHNTFTAHSFCQAHRPTNVCTPEQVAYSMSYLTLNLRMRFLLPNRPELILRTIQ
jgi:hypothetical protein